MTHDIEDLLALIKMLEARIIKLEQTNHSVADVIADAWYWDH
jgi:hypothetical protein